MTELLKPIHRTATATDGKRYVISMLPPDGVYRFPRITVRPAKTRAANAMWLALDTVILEAARRKLEERKREKLATRKAMRMAI